MAENSQPARRKLTPEQIQDKIAKRKQMAQDPRSIVFFTRSEEGRRLGQILYPFDKAVNTVGLRGGARITFDSAEAALAKARAFLNEFENCVREFAGESSGLMDAIAGDYFTHKLALANTPQAQVFIPRTDEGRRAATLVQRLDPAVIRFRSVTMDPAEKRPLVQKLVKLVYDFHVLTGELSAMVGLDYRKPGNMEELLVNAGLSNGKGKGETEAAGPGEVEPHAKKGAKTAKEATLL